jgi:gliding motility-associated-like protein
VIAGAGFHNSSYAQLPANDDCSNAIEIVVPQDGFGLGNFTSAQSNLTNATVQTGEFYAPAILVAGLDKKSVWYKFSIPTIRAVRVTLTQPGTTITAGDAGFTVYQASACLPNNTNISSKLTPIVTFGNTYHPCVPAGDYLVQVSSKLAANGPINIVVEISDQTGAAYDHPNQAYAFGIAANFARRIDFETECQSIEDSAEICATLFNYKEYHKSAWFTFTTPAYFDYMAVTLSGTGATTYFPSGGANILKRFGYTLYQGNVVTTDYNTLPVIDGCDSIVTNGYRAGVRRYTCGDLQPNTTYSIQLFFHKDFKDMVRLGLLTGGVNPTAAPLPVTGMPVTNALGVLNASPAGITHTMYDYFGCNSRHSVTACNPSIPAAGVTIGAANYNLSSFGTFTLQGAAAITFRPSMTQCGPRPVIRLFKQTVTANCADLDTANIVGTASYNQEIECLTPGDYVVQVLGNDAPLALTSYFYNTPTNNYDQCLFTNLGSQYRLDMVAYSRKANNKYSLKTTGAFDSINRVGAVQQPLANGVAYLSSSDTVGCEPTLRPWDTTCSSLNDKVIYRQFLVADSGTVKFGTLVNSNNPPFRYRLYQGDANALAAAQNVFNFPDRINGLVPWSLCMDGYVCSSNKSACVTPGTYTFTSLASVGDVGRVDRPTFTFTRTRTLHNSPFTAQDLGSIMDTLGVNGGTKKTDVDVWSCDDNAVPINGYQPCALGGRPATKAIYRQFFLKDDALVRIANTSYSGCDEFAYGTKTLFTGKATDGLGALVPVGNQWNCFSTAQTANGCTFLPAGWYTVVSYGTGPNYDSSTRLTNVGGRYNSHVGYKEEFTITITPACPGPKYNRPYKASVNTAGQPHLIQWANFRPNSTAAYPRNDTTYILPTENFNCTLDTPFTSHPIKSCETAANRVAYYVFRTTEVCFLQINAAGYFATVYDRDVRSDSLQFANALPIQQCNSRAGFIQFCFFQPGTYTLVVFAKDANICRNVTPSIYIDKIGYSRFDYAANAYDFDVVPPDNIDHYGKVGDVNPLNGSRQPSNDFFYCTTGAFATDPTNGTCNTRINPYVYNNGPNKPLHDSAFPATADIPRRNLWYTFVAADAGTVRIRVENKTTGRALQPKFAVFRSNVDASLPFTTVVANGEVDSTIAQGLTYIGTNLIGYPYYCYSTPNNISFYRDPCTSIPNRYYILVENVNGSPNEPGGLLPNSQVEVSVLIDSVNLVLPKFDHYYEAGDFGTVGVGAFTGPTDNYSCATRDGTDPVHNTYNTCRKTLWYKFTSTITGNVRYRIRVNNATNYGYDQVQLHRQTIDGDSTSNGLKIQLYSTVNSPTGAWAQTCVSPGTYYLLLPGCNMVNQYVAPEIELIEAVGDFCNRAIPAVMPGAGAVTATVLVNCHTIGTDYGEFGPKLTCPPDANTIQYKSSWFRMDIGGTDTLDVTAYLEENTNASSSDIKYRLMTGDCGAMQEQSCVLDALTQNTYQCLVPGQSYYVQVFTPLLKNNVAVTGTIDLKLSAVAHMDTCAPLTNCLVNANFDTAFNCSTGDSVKFVNFSTYGTSISYLWDFGHNGQTSTAVSPSFFYPALPSAQSYTVKLVVTNNSCQQKDSVTKTITIPGRPYVNLGPDIAQCNSTAPITLWATSHPGATYVWQNNSTADSFRVTATGNNNYRVAVTYNGCTRRDTVRVLISPISARPLQQINLCTDSVSVDVRRGFGETYQWNTGATTRSIFMSMPGYYWVDITYFDCVYRDSFEVNNVNASKPFGGDTTICLSNGGIILDATMPGALSYLWQNNSTADTFLVTVAGQYRVAINYGNCTIRDTINIAGYPAPVTEVTDTTICEGEIFQLPWGVEVGIAGTYQDTLEYAGGCDSLIRRVNLTVKAKPAIGQDTTICFAQGAYTIDATTAGAVSYSWQDGDTSAVYTVNTPGLYWVTIGYGSCSAADTVVVSDFSAPQTTTVDTGICLGSSFTLPWGVIVDVAGTYSDTLPSSGGGCDSLIRVYNLSINPQPVLGNDVAENICSGSAINLNSYFNTAGLTASWTLNNNPVPDPTVVNTAGTYRLIAANNGGCSDTAVVVLTVNNKPVLGNDTAISTCNGAAVNLDTYYNISNLTTTWTLNGSVVPVPGVVTTAGVYQLIAGTNFGCSDTALLTLTVTPAPTAGNDSSIMVCLGDSVDLTGIYNTGGFSATWTLNANPVNNPAAVTSEGNYQLVLSNAGGCSDTAIVTIAHHPAPSLGIDGTQGICQGNSIDLNNVFATTGLTTAWTLNGLPVADPSFVNASGQYQLIAANVFGCADTALFSLTVNPKPSLGNDTAITRCSGSSIDLTSLYTTAGLTANWTLNAVAVASPSAITTPGNYQLIATSAGGCADTVMVSFTVNPKPALGNDTAMSICGGNFVNLTTLYNTTGLAVSWTLNGNAVANPSSIGLPGAYLLIAGNNFGCSDTAVVTLTANAKPVLGNDTAIAVCSGSTLDLTSLYTTTGLTTSWTLNTIAVANPFAINAPGNYQLIAVSPAGCADTTLVSVTVNPKPLLGNDTIVAICQGFVTDLEFFYNTTGLATNWTINGIVVANPSSVNTSGIYRLVASNNFSCSDTALVTLTVNPKPSLGNDTAIAICQGNTLNLTAVYNTGANSSSWTNAGVPVNTPAAVSIAGVYQLITLTAAACADTALVTLTVNTKPAVLINNPATICVPLTVDLTAAAISAGSTPGLDFTYWRDTAATLAFDNAATATDGTYYIKGTTIIGCFDIKPVTVSSYPVQLVAAGNDVGICDKDSTATLSVTVSNSTVPVAIQWEPAATGGIASPNAASTVVKPPTTPQQYIVSVTDGYGCNYAVSDTVLVTRQPPVPAFAGNDTIAVTGLPHQLLATGGVNYIWAPDNLLNNPFIANPLATIIADSILFSVTVFDIAGCKGYDSVWVKTYNGITYYVPNAFTPNGDGLNDVFRPIPVGIVSTEMFRVFNRYGQLVFETSQWMKGWDGMYKGRPQPVGNYVWVLKGKGRNGKMIEMKGNVVLVR